MKSPGGLFVSSSRNVQVPLDIAQKTRFGSGRKLVHFTREVGGRLMDHEMVRVTVKFQFLSFN